MMNKKENILNKVLWFNNRNKFEIDFFDLLQSQRIVWEYPRYKRGVYYSEKCKRDIQYESGIELEFIKQLEQIENVSFYWEQPARTRHIMSILYLLLYNRIKL